MIKEMLKTIKLLFEVLLETLRFGSEQAAKKVKEKVGPYIRLYFRGLLFLLLITFLSPIPFLIIGIVGDWRWLIALTGMWWALWTFILLIVAVPIGILIESLTSGIKGSGQRYVKRVSGIFLVGLYISLFASVVPIKANISMLPLLIVAAIILGILNVWFFSRKVIAPLVSVIFIALFLSFYFPTTFETLGEKISNIDISMGEPERLSITCESIEKQEIKFFRPDGKPKVWYYRRGDGSFELFNRKGHHPIYKEKLKPVTADVIPQLEKQLKADAERRVKEEQRKREEALRLDQQKQEEAKRVEEQRAARDHENFLNRYLLSRSFLNRPESQEVAVLVIDEGNRVSQDIGQKIASLLKTKGFIVTASLFTGYFVSDGIFEKIFKGEAGEFRKLELSKHSDLLILGKRSVNFTENPDMHNMISARVSVEIHVISGKTGSIEDSFTLSEVGAGFSGVSAEGMAVERIVKNLVEIMSGSTGRKDR